MVVAIAVLDPAGACTHAEALSVVIGEVVAKIDRDLLARRARVLRRVVVYLLLVVGLVVDVARAAGVRSTFERCTREVAGLESRLGWHLVHSRPRIRGIHEPKLCTRVREYGLRASHRPVFFRAINPRAQLHLTVRVVRVVQPMSLVRDATIGGRPIGLVDAIDSLNVIATVHVVRSVQAAFRLWWRL